MSVQLQRPTRRSKVTNDAEIEKITVDTSMRASIEVTSSPVSTTLMVFDDNVIISDPTAEEESLSSCILTIAVCNGEVCYIRKPGGTPFNKE